MTRIALTADWHLRGKDLDVCYEQIQAMAGECAQRGVNWVVVAGDIFDRSTIGDNDASTGAIAEAAICGLSEFTDKRIRVLVIPGNHDKAGAGSMDALTIFGSRVIVLHEATMNWPIGPDIRAKILPWQWSGELPPELFDDPCDLLIAHISVKGGRMASKKTCDKDGQWTISRADLERIPVRHVALGDFHARQDLTDGRGGYIGALRQCNFGEEDNPAGFEIWDSDTGLTEWVELDAAPKHRTIVVEPGEPTPTILADPKWITRVQIEGNLDHAAVRKLENAGAIVEQIIPREERVIRAVPPPGVVNDSHGLIDLWASTQNPEVGLPRVAEMKRTFDALTADAPAPEKVEVPV